MARATSARRWPPSVRVRMVMRGAHRAAAPPPGSARRSTSIVRRRRRRARATGSRLPRGAARAPLLLVGEAAGYRGARVSGIPFTSERQLTGRGPAEATATIVHRSLAELGLEEETLLLERRADPSAPTRAPAEPPPDPRRDRGRRRSCASSPRAAGRRRRPRRAGGAGRAVRSPPEPRRRGRIPARGCYDSAAGGRVSAAFPHEDLERKAGRDRAPLVRRRRRGPDPRPPRHPDRRHAARQGQAAVHAARRHRRLRRRRERREDRASRATSSTTKMYHRHSGYPGGLKSRPLRDELERRPTEVLRKAVKGMLPRNRLARAQITQAQDLRRPRASARGAGAGAELEVRR